MRSFTDPLGRTVTLAQFPPQRIVSLCPSQTELLFALGAGSRVVGRTRWCIHPQPEVSAVAAVGGTKKVNRARVAELAPNLILGEKEENTPALIAELEALAPTYVTNVESVADAHAMIAHVGALIGAEAEAAQLSAAITARWQGLVQAPPLRVAYLIWREPWMGVGATTYIHSVLTQLGLVNALAALPGRYPELALEQFVALGVQRVLLSSEPYAFTAADADALAAELALPVDLVDGEAFSWYGARMLPAADALARYTAHLHVAPTQSFRG